jgi:hypothetical protein
MIDDYNFYSSFPGGLAFAQQIYKGLQEAAPQGFQLNRDGTLSLRPGFAEGGAEVAGAKATAEQTQARITQAVAPQRTRAGESVYYPPGSPLAPGGSLAALAAAGGATGAAGGAATGAATTAAAGGAAPGVLTPTPGGGAIVGGTAPPQATETFYKRFDELASAADAARTGLYQANLLQERLHQLPSTGPFAEYFGQLSALAGQMGVPQSTIDKFGLPKPGDTEAANKLSTDLLGEILRAQFPGRITNTDIQTMAPTIARATTPMAANDFLLNQIVRPKMQRDIDRYGSVAALPQQDPTLGSLASKVYEWDSKPENSFEAYAKRSAQPTAAAAPAGAVALPPGATAPTASPPATTPPAGTRRLRWDPASKSLAPQ